MDILIIEDEPLAAKRLIRLLGDVAPDFGILDTLDSVSSAVAYLETHKPDLIFLDIHLADGNSFSIFEQVEVKVPIIFVTAYDQYAIKAFKLNSIDYLLKPIEVEELEHAVGKFREAVASPAAPEVDYEALLEAIKPRARQDFQKRFMVNSADKIRSIPVEDVAYFFGQQKFVFLITHDNRRFIVDFTLGKLETLLDPDHFFRINRQFIIGFKAINQMVAYSKSRVKIDLDPTSDIDAIVSIEKTRHFKTWLNR